MKHVICLLATLLLHVAAARSVAAHDNTDATRPRVAVVLAGGGAKGVAHLGALKVIEETGIPIDMVVGNSMGALVGGLYSLGYSPDEIVALIGQQDWKNLLLDNPNYGRDGLAVRKLNEQYILQVPIDAKSKRQANGVLKAQNVSNLLHDLTFGLSDSVDFSSFPIPFACIATEAQTGTVYEFHSGNLVEAMRASMAIPGVFTPVRRDTLVFVDGGVTNNFPVDVARRMGADVIIGLDLYTEQTAADKMGNAADIISHLLDCAADSLYRSNIRDCDLYIPINATGYTAASFTPVAIDTLRRRGEQTARSRLTELVALKTGRLHLSAEYMPAPTPSMPGMAYKGRDDNPVVVEDLHPHSSALQAVTRAYRESVVNLGARFDNDEHASLLLGVSFALSQRYKMAFDAQLRLGQRLRLATYLHHRLFNIENVNLGYEYQHYEPKYYLHGDKTAQLTVDHNRVQFHFGQDWHNVSYQFGLRFDYYAYSDPLLGGNASQAMHNFYKLDSERQFVYFAKAEYNSLNSLHFPTRGGHIEAGVEIVGDKLLQFNGHAPFPIGSVYAARALSPNTRFTFMPSIEARLVFCDDETPLSLCNLVGGLARHLSNDHQMTSVGLAYTELQRDMVFVAGLKLQQRVGNNHFIVGEIGGASMAGDVRDNLKSDALTWGVNFGYSYRSAVGPLSATGYWSDYTKELAFLLNLGFFF